MVTIQKPDSLSCPLVLLEMRQWTADCNAELTLANDAGTHIHENPVHIALMGLY